MTERAHVHFKINDILREDIVEGDRVSIQRDKFCAFIEVENGRLIRRSIGDGPLGVVDKLTLNYTNVEAILHYSID